MKIYQHPRFAALAVQLDLHSESHSLIQFYVSEAFELSH